MKYYCVVESCSSNESSGFKGWTILSSLKNHLNKHLNKSIKGEIDTKILTKYKWCLCNECGLITNIKHPTHKECNINKPSTENTIDVNNEDSEEEEEEEKNNELPSIEEIINCHIMLATRIPYAAVTTWTHALANCISDLTFNNSIDNWKKLLMLPKCILWKNRGGIKKKKHYVDSILKKIRNVE